MTISSGESSHAEGESTTASGLTSHAEGYLTIAGGENSHAQNNRTEAIGSNTHAGGQGGSSTEKVIAKGDVSFVHFYNNSGSNKGAYGDRSAILGGQNHNIGTGSTSSGIFVGDNSVINDDVLRSVVLGGQGLTATTSDTVFVPTLNINSIGAGSPIINLGLDVNGFVVTGATSPQDIYVTGTTFGSNEAILTRTDGFDVFKLSGGSNVTLSNPSTNQILIDVATSSVTGIKSNNVPGASFTGSPKTYTVTFTTPYPNTNYSITITGGANRTYTYQSKSTTGFVINANAAAGFTEAVDWITMAHGEF